MLTVEVSSPYPIETLEVASDILAVRLVSPVSLFPIPGQALRRKPASPLSEGVSLCACACGALPEGFALPEGAAVPFRVRAGACPAPCSGIIPHNLGFILHSLEFILLSFRQGNVH